MKFIISPQEQRQSASPLVQGRELKCLHFKMPIICGISEPAYTPAQLMELKERDKRIIEFEGKQYTTYEATQVQRKLETAARHAKDRQIIAKAAGDDTLMRQEQEKINLISHKYKAFSDAAELPTKAERMSVSGYRRVGVKPPKKAAKIVDNGSKSGIIKEKAKKLTNYKRFDLNSQSDYDTWANKYYSINKPRLTTHDCAILKEYTDGSYTAINAATRYKVGSEPYNKVCKQYHTSNLNEYKKLSDDISKTIKKFELDDDIICHRYVSKADYITGSTSSVEDLKKAIGKEYTEKGFTSTCLFEHLTKKFGGNSPIHLEIKIPRKSAGAYINDFSEKKNLEYEYLLDRGTRFRILDGGERNVWENKWITAERTWKDVKVTEKYMILEVIT